MLSTPRRQAIRAAVLVGAVLAPLRAQAAPANADPASVAVMGALLRQAEYWRGQGNSTQSEHVLRRALAVDPRNADALAGLVRLQAEAGHFDAAGNSMTQLAAAAPDDPRVAALGALVRDGPADPQDMAEAGAPPKERPAPVVSTPGSTPLRYALYVPPDTTSDVPLEAPPAFQPFVRAGGTRPMPRAIDPPPDHAMSLVMPATLDLPPPVREVSSPASVATQLPAIPTANPFRAASLTDAQPGTPGRLAASSRLVDSLTQDIDRSIAQLSVAVAPQAYGGISLRGRSGSDGTSRLTDLEAPLEATFSPNGVGKLKISVTPVARAVQRSCATATESDVQHALREATVLLRGGILKGGNL